MMFNSFLLSDHQPAQIKVLTFALIKPSSRYLTIEAAWRPFSVVF